MSRCTSIVTVAVLTLAFLRAVSADTADPTLEEIERLRQAAAEALADRKPDRAATHLARALELDPDSAEVHEDILRLCQNRPEDFALWSRFVTARGSDGKGVWPRPKDFPSALLRPMRPALECARIRAEVSERLAGMAKRLHGVESLALAKYLRSLARLLAEGSPALSGRRFAVFEDAVARCLPESPDVLDRLSARMDAAFRSGEKAAAIRAATILRGAVVQARHAGIELSRRDALEASALDVMEAVRREQAAKRAPLSVEDLRRIPPRFRPTWERMHRDWSNPTVALSPNGRYRIESTCGVRTALIGAADVEFQHARLVRWFGRDPFLTVPGLVRLCRSPTDLEGQGKPFWWAPGFQSGDMTGLTVNFDDRYGLAAVLTHELTHRFDGRIYPGLPAWLLEGRAVFTASGTLWPRSRTVEPRVANFGALYDAAVKGYGDPKNLARLIQGKVEDYRHYYPVGYSLWIYLTRLRKEWFSARVEPYMKSFAAKAGRPPLERFARFFLDGKEGRPADFESFTKDFGRFLGEAVSLDDGFPWKKAWIEDSEAAHREANRQIGEAARAADGAELSSPRDRAILDHSNHPRIRWRSAAPAFGEGQAWAAGLWFEAGGRPEEAAKAFAWAREVDEATDEQLLHMAALHERERHPVRGWLLRLAASRRSLSPVAPGAAPAEIRKIHRALAPLHDALASMEASAREAGQPRVARAAAADRHALARRAGLPTDPTEAGEPAGRSLPPPDCGPFLGVLADGVVEERWAPADTQVSGNWTVDAPDLLILGSREPFRAISGNLRDAGVKRVFVRGREWFEGTYTARVRIRLVSAHVGAGIVVGHSRHDRGFVIHLDGGDFEYAIGRKEEDAGFRSIHVGIDDLRSYDGGVGRLGRSVPFESPRTTFLITIRVSGSFVQVRVDGRHVLSHRTTTGVPVAGRIGFLLGHGVLAFEAPAVRRHRTIGPSATCPCEHGDEPLDFSRPVEVPFETWPGRRVIGTERDPLGSVLLCYAGSNEAAGRDEAEAARAITEWAGLLGPEPARERIRALRPHGGLPSLERAMKIWLEEETDRRHARDGDRSREQVREELVREWRTRPPWISVDPRGVVLAAGIRSGPWSELARALTRRLRGF